MVRVVRLLVGPISMAIFLVAIVQAVGDGPVTKAVKAGDLPAVRKLIASKADVNAVSGDGATPLLWAVYDANVDMARALITAGAKVDVHD